MSRRGVLLSYPHITKDITKENKVPTKTSSELR